MLATFSTRRRTAAVAWAVGSVVLLSACGRGGDGDSISGSTAARVGDVEISRDKVLGAVDRALAGKTELTRKVLTQEHLTTQVKLVLYAAEANKRALTVTDEQLKVTKAALEEQTQQQGGLVKAAETSGIALVDIDDIISMVTYERVLGEHIIKGAPVTDAELDALRKDNPNMPAFVAQSRSAHILVKEEALAKKLLAEIKAGGDFAALATKHTLDTSSKEQGGDLGAKPKGSFVPAFEEALYAAKPGDIVGPVKTEFGYHIIKAIEFVTADQVKESVRVSAGPSVARTRLRDVVTAGTAVTVNPRFGRWNPDGMTVESADGDEDDPSAPSASPNGSQPLGAPDPSAPAEQAPAEQVSPEPSPAK